MKDGDVAMYNNAELKLRLRSHEHFLAPSTMLLSEMLTKS